MHNFHRRNSYIRSKHLGLSTIFFCGICASINYVMGALSSPFYQMPLPSVFGQHRDAAMMKRDVLKKRRCILGKEHLDTISAMRNLVITLHHQSHKVTKMQKHMPEDRIETVRSHQSTRRPLSNHIKGTFRKKVLDCTSGC
jgi:hypothetical protein